MEARKLPVLKNY